MVTASAVEREVVRGVVIVATVAVVIVMVFVVLRW